MDDVYLINKVVRLKVVILVERFSSICEVCRMIGLVLLWGVLKVFIFIDLSRVCCIFVWYYLLLELYVY